ncbi:hypothetical protein [Nitrosopumilus adriaticus]|uniref:Uncharacterized protein n=1 Tax=Nitrosopumilus adriaticus TaxID=1580092 RepID=A0A0D5C1D4_9ARCH|nr:hypothetical protein [Nitrosopumilus adriaticus]AJW70531.1 conserved exported protein of unknown function [Nitrosopumilus adriaticus]
MKSLPIIALLGIAILVTSTVGFGATLTNTPTFNLIGASDNNEVSTARGNITALTWTEEVSTEGVIETDSIVFAVGNEDTTESHDFQICAVIEGPVGTYTPAAGQIPACTLTGEIAAYANSTSHYINFTTPVNVTSIVDISFSIEELDQIGN